MNIPEFRFGNGHMVVAVGTYGGEPSVQVSITDTPGEVGVLVQRTPEDSIPLFRMVFPTMQQAQQVFDALSAQPQGPDNT